MAAKSRFVGVRLEPDQQRKLIVLSLAAGEPGNMSAALRMLVDRAAVPNTAADAAGPGRLAGSEQAGKEVHYA